MNLELTSDQRELQSAVVALLNRYKQLPAANPVAFNLSDDLDRDIKEGGYLDIARTEGYGSFEAALLVEAVCQLPYCNEVAASALVVPRISEVSLPGPVALAWAQADSSTPGSKPSLRGVPVRNLPRAKSIVVGTDRDVRVLDAAKCKTRVVDSSFGYPIGVVEQADIDAGRVLDAKPAELRHAWQLALSAETLGCAQASIDLTLEFLKQRKQFGKHIGSFQALQHRISECVTLLESLRVLVYRAACGNKPGDAALAAFYAQDAAARIVMETQQMHGAMGCTLEYPLHFWTYRMKVLQGELGGFLAQAESVAEGLWND